MTPRRRARGFTLIELLVGLVLLSFIVLGVYEALRTAVRTWEGATVRADEVARLRAVESFVRRHVSQAAFMVTGRGSRATVAFSGDAHNVTFVSELPAYLGGGGLYDFALAFERAGDGEQLLVRFRPAQLDEDDEDEDPDATVLIEAVSEGGFEYYGTPRGRADPAWHDTWDDAERLPLLVAVQWTTPVAGVWPRLLIEPRADAVSARLGAGAVAQQPREGDDAAAESAARQPDAGAAGTGTATDTGDDAAMPMERQ